MCIRDRLKGRDVGSTISYYIPLLFRLFSLWLKAREQSNNKTVSYTHLDVYKRQIDAMMQKDNTPLVDSILRKLSNNHAGLCERFPETVLRQDVYKRQA